MATHKTLQGHTERIIDMKLSPSIQELVVTISRDKSIRVWNIYTGILQYKVFFEEAGITCLCLDFFDREFILGSTKGSLIVYKTKRKSLVNTYLIQEEEENTHLKRKSEYKKEYEGHSSKVLYIESVLTENMYVSGCAKG